MNTKKREGIEKIGNIIGSIVTLDMQTKEKLAKALWDAGIRDASGFEIKDIATIGGCPFTIKPKVFKDGE